MRDAIRHLDKRFIVLRKLANSARPPKGWVRAIRDALGMTTAQVGRRLGVSQPRIVEIEQGEMSGSVTLNTMQRTAEALGCRFVYALIPDKPLERTVRERAHELAHRRLASVQHEISRVTGLSVSNIGYIIHTGIQRLRARIAPELAVEGVSNES